MIQTDSKFQYLRINYAILWIPILPIDDSIKNNRKNDYLRYAYINSFLYVTGYSIIAQCVQKSYLIMLTIRQRHNRNVTLSDVTARNSSSDSTNVEHDDWVGSKREEQT